MEAIEALADGVDVAETLKRLEAAAPAGTQFLTVTMPPFKSQRDDELMISLRLIGWKPLATIGRTVCFERTVDDLPERLEHLAGNLRHGG